VLLVLFIGTIIPSVVWITRAQGFLDIVESAGVPIAATLVSETLIRIQSATRQQIHRLETINSFSRQLASTLNRAEIFSLLNTAIPKAVAADSYYVGIQEGDEVSVPLFYDDGEYFNGGRVSIEGSLSGWVIKNNRELFLPDLREPLDLPGVNIVLAGKDKASLSWIGVPMSTGHFKGVIALASYQPNAFNRGDIELLANLSQHVALALENALIHEDVERRSRLDQMTGVLNHGFFLETLQKMADESAESGKPLSLIMLDVDHFKRYNDTYGHLVGDKVLNILCDTIRSHIKSTDAVGRWGGEEFIIALPNAAGEQAFHVAERIRKTMNAIKVPGRVKEPIPAPTVSQGIAEFPLERSSMYDLIDLADRRLYIAKDRGRNQIEPDELTWVFD
jgi:diguanylate cyclase (GGDEF)-like protein